MKYIPIAPGFFSTKRKHFSEKMDRQSVAVFHSNDEYIRNGDQYYSYRQNSDFFYLSGIEQEKSVLILAPDHPDPQYREILFILEADEQMQTWLGYKLSKQEAQEISGIKTVLFLEKFDAVLQELVLTAQAIYINGNESVKFPAEVQSRDLRFANSLKERYPAHTIKRAAPLLHELRCIKSQTEIALIKKACSISNSAFHRILKHIKPGVKEYEIQAEIEHEFLMHASNGPAYHPIIASGKNACILHYTHNNKTCKNGELLLMDFGAEYANYAADISRTVPVSGKFSKRQRECYQAVLEVQKKAIQLYTAGNTLKKLNAAVQELMEEELIKLGLLTKAELKNQGDEKPLRTQYLIHGIGHFLGLDVHDAGSKYQEFKAGMVLTCEPGLYIREENLGIRLENNILITEGEPVDLTADIPIEIDEIESLMTTPQ